MSKLTRDELIRTLRVYISTPYDAKVEAEKFAKLFRERGVQVTSTWHSVEEAQGEDAFNDAVSQDIDEVYKSDLLVLWDPPHYYSSGCMRHVEVGVALAIGTHVIRVYTPTEEKEGRSFYKNEKLVPAVEMNVETIVDKLLSKLGFSE